MALLCRPYPRACPSPLWEVKQLWQTCRSDRVLFSVSAAVQVDGIFRPQPLVGAPKLSCSPAATSPKNAGSQLGRGLGSLFWHSGLARTSPDLRHSVKSEVAEMAFLTRTHTTRNINRGDDAEGHRAEPRQATAAAGYTAIKGEQVWRSWRSQT